MQILFTFITQVSHFFLPLSPFFCCCIVFLGQLKSWIRLKLVDLSAANCWRQETWWLLILKMKKIPLDWGNNLWPVAVRWWSRLLTQGMSLSMRHACAVLLLPVQSKRCWFGLRTWISTPRVSRNLFVAIVEFLCSRFLICALLSCIPVVE